MMADQILTVLSLPFRPRRAMSALLDRGGVLPALLLAALASAMLWYGVLAGIAGATREPAAGAVATSHESASTVPLLMLASSFGPIATVAGLVFLYAPATLLLVTLFDRVGSFAVALRRDFGGLLVCTLSAFSVVFVPVGLAGLVGNVPTAMLLALAWAGVLAFAALMVVALQTACGANLGLDEPGKAKDLFERCVVAARTAPDHMQREVRPWRRAAERELRGL